MTVSLKISLRLKNNPFSTSIIPILMQSRCDNIVFTIDKPYFASTAWYDNSIFTLGNLCFSFIFTDNVRILYFFNSFKISKATAKFTIKNKSKHRSYRLKGVLFHVRTNLKIQILLLQGLSWSWSFGSWIYNYLCNRCLSPLIVWVRIPLSARCTTLCDKVC